SLVSGAVTPAGETSERRPPRRALVRLMFVGFSLVLSVVAVEIVGRLVFRGAADDARYYARIEENVVRSAPILEPQRKPGLYDVKFGYVLSPSKTFTESANGLKFTQRTNSLGFRTREIEPKLPGEYRVMLVGDSYFYGTWIEEDEALGVQIEEV